MAPKTAKLKVGRRKTSIARVQIFPGSGKITVNGRDIKEYFTIPRHFKQATASLAVLSADSKYDVSVNVMGGGISGQAGAVSLGIARSLDRELPSGHGDLKKAGLLTRDPRMVERKKYGLHKARRGTQFSKR
jgi:small subunit ribosomal protein S9